MRAPADLISRIGFRRWYERQLVEGHAWLVACFLAIILVAAGIELLSLERGAADFAFDALLIGGALLGGWFSWRRYAWIMMRADFIGEQANCPACNFYGFRCDRTLAATFNARCPKCKHEWKVAQPGVGETPP